ncbi:ZIP family metal transporter [Patescibacteria group bacterium]|nr:ZIP family metal transporter [Patescibacteria group bacterium]
MNGLFAIILATSSISFLSLSGVMLLFLREDLFRRLSIFLVAFAAGTLMGVAFLDLLPEAVGMLDELGNSFVFILIGFLTFFLIEKTLHWHHTHRADPKHAPLGMLSLVGDAFHNFIDGIILAAIFLVDVRLGMAATVAVALHEIPQEISEFGVLVYSGFSRQRALFLNFISATTVIVGGVVGFFLVGAMIQWLPLFLLFAVGTFLYLAASDFVPEIRKEEGVARSIQIFLIFVAGLLFMWLLSLVE